MARRRQRADLKGIREVRGRLDAWRAAHRGRLPEALWDAGVELARQHGVSRVSRALRLDYRRLKQRVESAEATKGAPACPATFVEVSIPPNRLTPECLLVAEDGAGRRLTVQLPASCAGEMAAVARALWRVEL